MLYQAWMNCPYLSLSIKLRPAQHFILRWNPKSLNTISVMFNIDISIWILYESIENWSPKQTNVQCWLFYKCLVCEIQKIYRDCKHSCWTVQNSSFLFDCGNIIFVISNCRLPSHPDVGNDTLISQCIHTESTFDTNLKKKKKTYLDIRNVHHIFSFCLVLNYIGITKIHLIW